MNGLLTAEDKKYLGKVCNYLGSLGMKEGIIDVDIDDGYFSRHNVNWNQIDYFSNNYRAEVPPKLIPIFAKISNYVLEKGLVSINNDNVNFAKVEFTIDCDEKEFRVSVFWSYYDEGDTTSDDWDDIGPLLTKFNLETDPNGELTLKYDGGGGDGYLSDKFAGNDQEVPQEIKDWCYNRLEDLHGGWENNEGGQGSFVFNFNKNSAYLSHTENIYVDESDTLYEESFM